MYQPSDVVAIYSDGGLVRCNPSPYAGVWAWCHVNGQGEMVAHDSGVVPWDGVGAGVTNNEMEALALIHGLESLPDGWSGRVCSDSRVGLSWVLAGPGYYSKCPQPLRDRAVRAVMPLGRIYRVLMNGHPSAAALQRGIGPRGLPCDAHQVWCDQECCRLTEGYCRTHHIPKGAQRAVQGQEGASGDG